MVITNKNKFVKRFLIIYIMVATLFITCTDYVRSTYTAEAAVYHEEEPIDIMGNNRQDKFLLPLLEDFKEPEPTIKYDLGNGLFVYISKDMARDLDERKEKERQEQEERERNTVTPVNKIEVTNISITQYTDLSINKTVTTDDMNRIIEYWNRQCGGTPFLGRGDVFIQASKESGLDPIYILAHAAVESSWGNSPLAINKANYFGIGAFDRDPYNSAYTVGDGLYTGIVNGSVWISDNYYNQGQTSLYSMIYGPKQYASAEGSWINQIQSIMNTSYDILESRQI